tara:strand:+ start:309 stop:464 length:156 start_codon:yes stop_codon:yes gene_type:complete
MKQIIITIAVVVLAGCEKFWKLMPPSDAANKMSLGLVAWLIASFGGRQAAA